MSKLWTIAIFLTGVLVSAHVSADLVTIPATRDNTIYSEDIARSNGAGDHIFAGATKDGFPRRALIAFDVAGAIPAGSTVNAVTLRLYLSRTRTQNQNVDVHRLLADWGEGASDASGEEGSGAPAAQDDATWRYRFYQVADPTSSPAWTSDGGDFDPTTSATAVVGNQVGYYQWTSAGLAADVQDWLDGALPDYGWILISNEATTRVAKRFDSRTIADSTHRPELVVDFTAPAPTGACCDPDGSCSVVLDPGGTCGGTYQGANTTCDPNLCPQPTGACCIPDASATCLEETSASCSALGGTFEGEFTLCAETACPVVLTPYLDPLPLPAVAQPVSGTPGGAASYEIAMREVQQQLSSELPPTTVWGYGDGPVGATYPGPTIEATTGQPITVTWINDLRDTSSPETPKPLRTSHYLTVDLCPHGAALNADAKTVVHLHGAHIASEYDGHPDMTFAPGQQAVYHYPNWQLPSTIWYHDHALGITRLNVQMGLAGFWLIRDAYEKSLGLPAGEYEIPLVFQDRSFNPDGSLQYPAVWQEVFFGNTNLVNGKVSPYLNVKRGKYRFRMLNGAGSRTYRLALSSGDDFQVLGMEGGLLPSPVPLQKVTLGPGERADVVVDFAPFAAGTEVFLVNDAPAPFPGAAGVGVLPDVMKFVVQSDTGHTDPLPAALRPMEVLQEADASVFREFHLEKGTTSDGCSPFEWEIRSIVNDTVVGSRWEDVTELPELGETEVWKFVNKSGMTHPMHMHLVMFQVLDRQAFELVGGVVTPIGSPVPPPPHEAGWKDTVQVGPNEIVRVIARFEDYAGLFPYHCHILEHEDHEMMRQFQAVATVPQCANGIDDDDDGLVDFAGGDPGCESADDPGEHIATLPCDDGIDNDGDGGTDYRVTVGGDIGCGSPSWKTESPQCQDGRDNDRDGKMDWDGGASAGVPPAQQTAPDPQCVDNPKRKSEAKSCGVGAELALGLGVMVALRRRRRTGA